MTTARSPCAPTPRRNREKLSPRPRSCSPSRAPTCRWRRSPSAPASGIGTLYRHFPTRDALRRGRLPQPRSPHLSAAADELLATHPPDVALARVDGPLRRPMRRPSAGWRGALKAVNAKTDLYSQTRGQITAPRSAGCWRMVQYGRRGGEDFGAEGVAAAGDLLAASLQRRFDLGPVGVAAAGRRRRPSRRAGCRGASTTITRPRTLSAETSDEPAGAARLRRVEELGGAGRDHVGLAARLALHLGVDAVAQAERQRHAEGDQRQQQHVGERQQEGGAEAYGSSSSGAAKRKPTPRTVSM